MEQSLFLFCASSIWLHWCRFGLLTLSSYCSRTCFSHLNRRFGCTAVALSLQSRRAIRTSILLLPFWCCRHQRWCLWQELVIHFLPPSCPTYSFYRIRAGLSLTGSAIQWEFVSIFLQWCNDKHTLFYERVYYIDFSLATVAYNASLVAKIPFQFAIRSYVPSICLLAPWNYLIGGSRTSFAFKPLSTFSINSP